MLENQVCKLCGEEKTLVGSHLIPKFVFRWLKKSGGKYIRKADNPNKRVEDGIKEYLFCNDCEQLFSKLEDKFARDLFYPYSNHQVKELKYDDDLLRFSISVLYRILLINLIENSQLNQEFTKELSLAQTERKDFLNQKEGLKNFSNIHILYTSAEVTKNVLPVERFLNYFARGIDGTILTNSKTCIVYAKMVRIILIGEIVGLDSAGMENTLIRPDEGDILVEQMRLNSLMKKSLIDRVRQINFHYDKVSEKQKSIANEYTDINLGKIDCVDIKKIVEQEEKAIIDEKLVDFE